MANNGKELGVLGYYGTYSTSLYRAYSGYGKGTKEGGYQLEKKAVEVSGNHFVWIKSQDNRCNGPFVPGRRAGSFR